MKQNEKGVTLIEVLGALMISSIVVGVIGMIFMSMNYEWNSTTSKYNDDTTAKNTLNLLTNYLSDSTQVCVKESEFLFLQSDGDIKRVRFEEGGSLFLENMYVDTNINLCNHTTVTNQLLLASNLKEAPQFNSGTIGTFQAGSMFTLTLTFNYTNYTVNGKSTPKEKVYSTKIKLFKEPS